MNPGWLFIFSICSDVLTVGLPVVTRCLPRSMWPEYTLPPPQRLAYELSPVRDSAPGGETVRVRAHASQHPPDLKLPVRPLDRRRLPPAQAILLLHVAEPQHRVPG